MLNVSSKIQMISKLHLILRPFLMRRMKEDVEQILSGQQPITPQARGRLDRLVEANEMKL